MSRYTFRLPDGGYVAWGADHAIGYFYDVFNAGDEDHPIASKDSRFHGLTKNQLIAELGDLGVPAHKLRKIRAQ